VIDYEKKILKTLAKWRIVAYNDRWWQAPKRICNQQVIGSSPIIGLLLPKMEQMDP
jgi:hypothetical protein